LQKNKPTGSVVDAKFPSFGHSPRVVYKFAERVIRSITGTLSAVPADLVSGPNARLGVTVAPVHCIMLVDVRNIVFAPRVVAAWAIVVRYV